MEALIIVIGMALDREPAGRDISMVRTHSSPDIDWAETPLHGKPESVFFVLSGPGGTGKSTLVNKWLLEDPSLGYVRNYTTRPARGIDHSSGVDDACFFEFVTRSEFKQLVIDGFFAQWVNPSEGYYSGTPIAPLVTAIQERRDLLFDYTPQLYINLKRRFPEQVVGVFVAPPSMSELRARLLGRGTDQGQKFDMKFEMGVQDLAFVDIHDYHVTNVNTTETLAVLQAILIAEKNRLRRQPNLIPTYDRLAPNPMLFYYDPSGSRVAGIDPDE
ncbi:MAG: hypothetical protein WB565_12205 [Acidimicrobiales bacterium]